MFVFLLAHTVTVFVDDAAMTPTPPPTVTPANTPTRSNTPAERREYDRDLGKWTIPQILDFPKPPTTTAVPKYGVSRSKGLLKPQRLPHQYWGLEFRTSLTKAGMVRNVVPHLAPYPLRLVERKTRDHFVVINGAFHDFLVPEEVIAVTVKE